MSTLKPPCINTVLLVDDHPLIRQGMAQILQNKPASLQVIEAATAKEAFHRLAQHPNIDCLFLDLQLPDMCGLVFLDELKHKKMPQPVVILSANEDAAGIDRCFRAGARGYLSKTVAVDEIFDALHALQQAQPYVAKSLRQRLSDYRHQSSQSKTQAVQLTRRQKQVLQLLSNGLSNQEIAAILHICESTVKGHVATLFTILKVSNRTQCAKAAQHN